MHASRERKRVRVRLREREREFGHQNNANVTSPKDMAAGVMRDHAVTVSCDGTW